MPKREEIPLFLAQLDCQYSPEEVEKAYDIIAEHSKSIEDAKRNSLVQCTTQFATGKGCGAFLTIKDLTYIQTHWYVKPYGCTGGDYYRPGEGQFKCPHCGHINRLYVSPEVEAMKPYFKDIEQKYEE